MQDERTRCEEALRVLFSANWISETQYGRILGSGTRRAAILGIGKARPEGPVVLYARDARGQLHREPFDSQKEGNARVAELNGHGYKGCKSTPGALVAQQFTRIPLAEDLPAWQELAK